MTITAYNLSHIGLRTQW